MTRCPDCQTMLLDGEYDLTIRWPDGGERLVFSAPANLCHDCNQVYVSPALAANLEIFSRSGRVVMAIAAEPWWLRQVA